MYGPILAVTTTPVRFKNDWYYVSEKMVFGWMVLIIFEGKLELLTLFKYIYILC
jgi:hypothetical protein